MSISSLILLLLATVSVFAQSPTANAGPDRTALVNEVIALNGTGSTNAFDGLQADGRYSIRWSFGYGNWTYESGLIAPVAYPEAGVYTVTLTVCNSGGTCSSDTAQITVSAITEGTVTTVTDTGNPVTNGINLCNAIISRAADNNPVIEVTKGVVYRRPASSACLLPNRTGAGYLTIRSTAHASLPNGATRVFPSDASNMAIMETGVHQNNPNENSSEPIFRANTTELGGAPAHHYRFIGLHFRKTFPTLNYANPRGFFDLGNGSPTSLSHLPHHFQIDRCFIDGGNTTASTARGAALQVTDSAVVNSYIYRVQGVGIEVQAIWVGMGERIAVINNYLSATSENFLSGGNDVTIRITQNTAQSTGNDSTHIKLAASEPSTNDFYKNTGIYIASGTGAGATSGRIITAYDGATKIATVDRAWGTIPDGTSVYRIGNHVPTDVVVRRNHMPKDLCWRAGESCYYGVNMVVKNIFELKQGQRWSIEGNRFETHWMEDQNWSVVLTVKNQDGRQPWSKFSHIDFSHNKMINVGNGFQILVSDWANPSLGTDHMLIRHNIVSGVSVYDGSIGFRNFGVLQDSGSTTLTTIGDKVMFVRNSTDAEGFDGKGRLIMFETSTRYRNFVMYGNIGQGFFTQNGPTGQDAIIAGTGGGDGSFNVTKNGFFRPSGTNPADNTTVSTRADVQYTDIPAHNLKLRDTSPFLATGPAGGRAGANTDAVDLLTEGCISGVWGSTPPPPSTSVCRWSDLTLCAVAPTPSPTPTPSGCPGFTIEGFAANTVGGCGGTVYTVTNLNDSGTGSLRQFAELTSGPRIIRFNVSGTIHLSTRIRINNPFVTIDGSTAPNQGIAIRGGLIVEAAEVILRYLRVRPGIAVSNIDALQLGSLANNFVADHCSFTWATDGLADLNAGGNVTVQHSIVSELLVGSGAVLIYYGNPRVTFHHNLLANSMGARHPELGRGDVDWVNNVIYRNRAGPVGFWYENLSAVPPGCSLNPSDNSYCDGPNGFNEGGPVKINYTGNYFKAGPSENTSLTRQQIRLYGARRFASQSLAYFQGNIGPSRPNDTLPQTDIMLQNDGSAGYIFPVTATRINHPLVSTTSAAQALIDVLANAGPRLPCLDPVDTRILNDVKNGTGKPITNESEVGGYPNLTLPCGN